MKRILLSKSRWTSILETSLKNDGFEVVPVSDKQEAFSEIDKGNLDGILMDLRLRTGEDGIKIVEYALSKIPTILAAVWGNSPVDRIEQKGFKYFYRGGSAFQPVFTYFKNGNA